ncbi:helix-turn-helix domain-containing protein [Sneathiella sp.]|uniref:helix-turn-helix domain-containing protein n=1 Tax=Sneathiella sp. TaxID=1964365 RepID=UPI0039E23E35
MINPTEHIAKNVKWFRQQKKWSLSQAAVKTGVSKAMLGQIERGESSPTIATIWKIVKGFDLSLSSLLEPVPASIGEAGTVIRDANDLRRQIADDTMLVAPLFPYDPTLRFEYFELTFPAGYERLSEPHKAGVVEILTVISGALEVLSENVWHLVTAGQSIRLHGDQPHGYRNSSANEAVVLTVINDPGDP